MTTNYERIKAMSVEELTKVLNCDCCIFRDTYCEGNCTEVLTKWLESEAEN